MPLLFAVAVDKSGNRQLHDRLHSWVTDFHVMKFVDLSTQLCRSCKTTMMKKQFTSSIHAVCSRQL